MQGPELPVSFVSQELESRLSDIEHRIRGLYEHVPFGAYCTDEQGLFSSINATQLAWLGLPADALLGHRHHHEFLTAASQDRLRQHAALYGRHGFAGLELELVGSTGQTRPVAMTSMPLPPVPGSGATQRVVMFDMSEYADRLRRQRIAALAFSAAASICITDANGIVLEVNQAFSELTGYSSDELRGRDLYLLHGNHHDAPFNATLWNALRTRDHWEGEIRDRRKDGSEFVGWLSIAAIRQAGGELSNLVSMLYDITRSKARDEEISHLAFYDSLTQLPNRQLLQDRLARALSSLGRTHLSGALLFIDMDNFKSLNDTQGHAAGDQLLIEVGRRLRACVRDGDSVARIGGDEFVVLLCDLASDLTEAASQASHIGRKILATLAQPYLIEGHPFSCTASVGVSLFKGEESDAELLQQADLAMYEAKKAGRNSLCFFNPAMQASITARASIEQSLATALDHNELVLYTQPQFDAQFQITGAEALLRWQHPRQGLLSPGHFLETAEESGLIVPIGNWVLLNACEQLVAWAAIPELARLKLSVNVSARQFARPEFSGHLVSLLEQTGANPQRLMLELTETTVHDVNDIRAKMLALQRLGITFSLDDFGNGYSSLARLIELPIHELKIDMAFVQGAKHSHSARVVVETIIGMADTLGLNVVAEGVETAEQMHYLQQAGCHCFQGYLLSPAVPPEQIVTLISRPSDHQSPST